MTMTDLLTRLCGAGQVLDNLGVAGVLSTNWFEFTTTIQGQTVPSRRTFGGGQLVVARFGVTADFDSATDNATIDLQIITTPKSTGITGTFTTVDADISLANNTFTEVGHGLINGTRVTVASSAAFPITAPTQIAASQSLYLRNVTADTFQLSFTPDGPILDISANSGGATLTWTWHSEILVAVPGIPLTRLLANKSVVEVGLPPPQLTPRFPVHRFLFGRFVPSATLSNPNGGTITCDLVSGYAMDGQPTNPVNYVPM